MKCGKCGRQLIHGNGPPPSDPCRCAPSRSRKSGVHAATPNATTLHNGEQPAHSLNSPPRTAPPKSSPKPSDPLLSGSRTWSVEVDGVTWRYQLGRGNAVIVLPDGKKVIVGYARLTDRSPDTIERGQYKGTSDGMVTPEHVRRYIRQHLTVRAR